MRSGWISADRRAWWSMELVGDLAEKNTNAYHKFLWAHHLGYAAPYEVADRFGAEKMRPSRLIFFQELRKCMDASGISGKRIRSVLEVGCSLGYQLRYLETDLFPEATLLQGIDIDDYAVRTGQEYLSSLGSGVSLVRGDIQDLDRLVSQRAYDLILCTGVLMYLKQHDAADLVRNMLLRCRGMLAMAGLAHPQTITRCWLAPRFANAITHSFITWIRWCARRGEHPCAPLGRKPAGRWTVRLLRVRDTRQSLSMGEVEKSITTPDIERRLDGGSSSVRFRVSEGMVAEFAALTGDRSAPMSTTALPEGQFTGSRWFMECCR